ncbi:MAG: ABC transporter ATP-binding protein [Burkholderiales bacterium]|nr:ABC transporter ATP-binding protein [Burkholderiales bacterium]
MHEARSRDAIIRIRDLSVQYERFRALEDVALDVYEGEFVCLLGPSGCGKTTLLNAIAGFVFPSAGTLSVNGKPVRAPGPDRGMVFQEYALFPWFTVEQNVQYGPRLRGVRGEDLRALSRHYLGLVRLSEFAGRYPNQLSGGMRQRVAIARALANHPAILLLDEPFGALDALTREALQDELVTIWEKERRTCVFVTHSLAEAVYLADRVVVMASAPGRIQAVLNNPLPRPRERASAPFFDLYRTIDGVLRTVLTHAEARPSTH